ncbi:MAG: glycosyltransferase [Methanophagales archaeon]|nr:glycosyltransferase [Methanophagales archaeon]
MTTKGEKRMDRKLTKIAIFSKWNAADGTSILAELVGRELAKRYELTVFAPFNDVKPLQGIRDEDYVIRCCNVQGTSSGQWTFDPKPFLEKDYDIFVLQRIEWIPIEELIKIYPNIKEKAKVIYVIHELKLPENPIFWKFEWDAVVCFDERYKRMWKDVYPEEKIHMIPYPCNSLRRGDKNKSRMELNLPLDKKIVFTCSWYPSTHVLPLIPPLAELNKKYPFIFLIVVAREYLDDEMLKEIKRYDFIEWRDDMPPASEMDKYFYASDAYIFYKPKYEFKPGQIMVSSSILSYLGTLTPVLAIESPHIQPLGGAVMKFSDMEELKDRLISVFEGKPIVNETLKTAEEYVIRNSKEKVAIEYIELFEKLMRG